MSPARVHAARRRFPHSQPFSFIGFMLNLRDMRRRSCFPSFALSGVFVPSVESGSRAALPFPPMLRRDLAGTFGDLAVA